MSDRGRTHWDGCDTHHPECASVKRHAYAWEQKSLGERVDDLKRRVDMLEEIRVGEITAEPGWSVTSTELERLKAVDRAVRVGLHENRTTPYGTGDVIVSGVWIRRLRELVA